MNKKAAFIFISVNPCEFYPILNDEAEISHQRKFEEYCKVLNYQLQPIKFASRSAFHGSWCCNKEAAAIIRDIVLGHLVKPLVFVEKKLQFIEKLYEPNFQTLNHISELMDLDDLYLWGEQALSYENNYYLCK